MPQDISAPSPSKDREKGTLFRDYNAKRRRGRGPSR